MHMTCQSLKNKVRDENNIDIGNKIDTLKHNRQLVKHQIFLHEKFCG